MEKNTGGPKDSTDPPYVKFIYDFWRVVKYFINKI